MNGQKDEKAEPRNLSPIDTYDQIMAERDAEMKDFFDSLLLQHPELAQENKNVEPFVLKLGINQSAQ